MFFTEPEYESIRRTFSLIFCVRGDFLRRMIGAVATLRSHRATLALVEDGRRCAPRKPFGSNVLGRPGMFSADVAGQTDNLPWGVRFTELGHENHAVP